MEYHQEVPARSSDSKLNNDPISRDGTLTDSDGCSLRLTKTFICRLNEVAAAYIKLNRVSSVVEADSR